MSFKKINALREAGKLDEALQKAQEELQAHPENIWKKRAVAWVYHDYLKKYSRPKDYDAFKDMLLKLKALNLAENESAILDQCVWKIGILVFGLQKESPVDYDKVDELLSMMQTFPISKPSEVYSHIFRAFHQGHRAWAKYADFVEWWGLENFRPEDYKNKDKKGTPIVEQAYITYAKKLLEDTDPNDAEGKEKIESFIAQLDEIIKSYPNFEQLPSRRAKLQVALGKHQEALAAFLPFAKQKRSEFWVWEQMAEIHAPNPALRFACYCKALSLYVPKNHLVKAQQALATALVEKQMYDEAKTEIKRIIDTPTEHQEELKAQAEQWAKEDWYEAAEEKPDNKALYAKYSPNAEEILFEGMPEEVIAIEAVNDKKQVINFIKNIHKSGYFSYGKLLQRPKVGDVLKVRFDGMGKDGLYKLLTVRKADPEQKSEAVKKFKGSVTVIYSQGIAFVFNAYIAPSLVQKHRLVDGQIIQGRAILCFNKRRKEWGWKVIEIN